MREQITIAAWPYLLGCLSWFDVPAGSSGFQMIAHQAFDFIRQGAQDPSGAVRPVLGHKPQQERPAGFLHLRDIAHAATIPRLTASP